MDKKQPPVDLADIEARAEYRMRHPAWDDGDMIRELLVALRRTREERVDKDYLDPRDALHLAQLFHIAYEELAPRFGYETRTDTRRFDPESPNGKLMIATVMRVYGDLLTALRRTRADRDEAIQRADKLTEPIAEGEVSAVIQKVMSECGCLRPPGTSCCPTCGEMVDAFCRLENEKQNVEADRDRFAAETLQLHEQLAGMQLDKDRLQTDLNEERQRCEIVEADCVKALDARDRLTAEVERLVAAYGRLEAERDEAVRSLRAELDEAKQDRERIASELDDQRISARAANRVVCGIADHCPNCDERRVLRMVCLECGTSHNVTPKAGAQKEE